MKFKDYVSMVRDGKNLSRGEAEAFLSLVLDNANLPDSDIAETLTLLTKKTVTAEEVCGFIESMRARMIHVPNPGEAIDTCGTGGDRHGTFNISTAAAILLAAGDIKVAKHGNRAASSKCGSADVLEALQIPVDLAPEAAARALAEYNFVFLFAPLYHPSLKKLALVRRQLGFPTVFNLLGPLLNPAAVNRQIVGTFSLANAELLAEVMSQMDYQHAMVLTSDDGLDEASLNATVRAFEIKKSVVTKTSLQAGDYGLKPAPLSALKGGDAAQNAKFVTAVLQPADILSDHQRVVVFNAGLGFYIAGKAPTIDAGIQKATEVLASGVASAKLKQLRGSK